MVAKSSIHGDSIPTLLGKTLSVTGAEEGVAQPSSLLEDHHLWCWIARYCDVVGAASLQRCSRWYLCALEAEALWHYFVFARKLARRVGPNVIWIHPSTPNGGFDGEAQINWRALLHANLRFGSAYVAPVWVRVGDRDLRLLVHPYSVAGVDPQFQLLAKISKVLQLDWQQDRERAPLLRLRTLQWGGRPGAVLTSGTSVQAGAHLVLEWTINGKWPLPPAAPSGGLRPWGLTCGGSSFAVAVPFFGGWIHNVRSNDDQLQQTLAEYASQWTQGQSGEAPRANYVAHSQPRTGQDSQAVVRVVSSLLDGDVWISINLGWTVGVLMQHLAMSLIGQYRSGALTRLPFLRLVDAAASTQSQPILVPEATLLQDLFWVQSETLRLSSSPNQNPGTLLAWRSASACGQEESVGASLLDSLGRAGNRQRRMHRLSWLHLEEDRLNPPSENASEPESIVSTPTCGWVRTTTEPAPPTHTEVSELPLQRGFSRQFSEPLPVLSEDLDDLEASTSNSSRQGSWEMLAPHFPPVVLPGTCQARQFEFHPSLPSVLLIGDQQGCVNTVNIDAKDSVQSAPLKLGDHAVVCLSWMRHCPARAVCGIARSGNISFLRYSHELGELEATLQPNEEVPLSVGFRQVTSLSFNCTDDFLLASGLNKTVAVFDACTGTLLSESGEVHDHFINVSRFSYGSPHIFASASLDHTCKLWDLRMPLGRDHHVRLLATDGPNVMCAFSPDDRRILCSGTGEHLSQFDLLTGKCAKGFLPRRPPSLRQKYRRSMYLASGKQFATAATDECHLRLMSATTCENLGVVDLSQAEPSGPACPAVGSSLGWGVPESRWDRQCVREGVVQLDPAAQQTSIHRSGVSEQASGAPSLEGGAGAGAGAANGPLSVQSLRAHPTDPDTLAVLLTEMEEGCEPRRCITLIQLSQRGFASSATDLSGV